MSSCRPSTRFLFALCTMLFSLAPGSAQNRIVSCRDPRVKDALILAVMER